MLDADAIVEDPCCSSDGAQMGVAAAQDPGRSDAGFQRPESMDAPPTGGDHLSGQVSLVEVTRLQMLEYINGREWWGYGQVTLLFTMALWCVFVSIMFLRSDVEASIEVHDALAQHVQHIVAHPIISGVPLLAPHARPVPCRCACRFVHFAPPTGPCDSLDGAEVFDFLGVLPPSAPYGAIPVDDGITDHSTERMTWDRIATAEEAWFWVEHGFIPDLWNTWNAPKEKNTIIGGIRARQVRAAWESDCDDKVSDKLTNFYGMPCRSADPAASKYGPANSLNGYEQVFEPTNADKGYFDALFDIERSLHDALATATFLRQNNWLDGASRSLELQGAVLNAELGRYALLRVNFTFPFSGGVEKRVYVHTVRAMGESMSPTDIVPELLWGVLILLLIRQEIAQLVVCCYRRRFKEYLSDIWNYVDYLSIVIGVFIVGFYIWLVRATDSVSDDVAALATVESRDQWEKIIGSLENIFETKQYYQLCLFWYSLVLTLRFLKGFLGQSKLAMLQISLCQGFWDIAHFLALFFVIFVNFLLGGHILFGAEMWSWSSLTKSASASVQMLMGTFRFGDMYDIAPFSATIWFWLFLLSMVFILLNLLFVIVCDHYSTMRKAIGTTPSILVDVCQSWADLKWRTEWRRENFRDGEYKLAFWTSPYNEISDGLMDICKVSEKAQRAARQSCLGLKLDRKYAETLSVEGMAADGDPGAEACTQLGLRELGADAMTADHLLECCQKYVKIESGFTSLSQLGQVREFVNLLRRHREDLYMQCDNMDEGFEDDHQGIRESLDRLERSVRRCLEEFDYLRTVGVHTLAPPPQAMPSPGTAAAEQMGNSFTHCSNSVLPQLALAGSPSNTLAPTWDQVHREHRVAPRPHRPSLREAAFVSRGQPTNAPAGHLAQLALTE